MLPPLPVPTSRDAVPELTQGVADALGTLIRQFPRQWIWIHPRWEESELPIAGPGGAVRTMEIPSEGGERRDACAAR